MAILRLIKIKKLFLYSFLIFQFIFISNLINADEPYLTDDFYAKFLGDYPKDDGNIWTEAIQGISNDKTHWYITQKDVLWRVPVTFDLAEEGWFCIKWRGAHCIEYQLHEGISGLNVRDIPDEDLDDYNHLGGFSTFEYPYNSNQFYLLIPFYHSDHDEKHRYVVVFKADTLEYIGKASLGIPDRDGEESSDAGWLAVDPNGSFYVSLRIPDHTLKIRKYKMDWKKLFEQGVIEITKLTDFTLLDEEGLPLKLQHRQGGVISPNGHLLYFSSGLDEAGTEPENGLHVFDLQSKKRIAKSREEGDDFKYKYGPGCDVFFNNCEEPEGLTFWDFDAFGSPNPPGISGQLHAILLNNDYVPGNRDEIYLKNYTIEEPDVIHWNLEHDVIQEEVVRHYQARDSITAGNNFTIEDGGLSSFYVNDGGKVVLKKGFKALKGSVLVVYTPGS